MKNKWPARAGRSVVIVPTKKLLECSTPEDAAILADAMGAYGRKIYAHGIKVGGTIGAVATLGAVGYCIYKARKEEEP